MFSIGH